MTSLFAIVVYFVVVVTVNVIVADGIVRLKSYYQITSLSNKTNTLNQATIQHKPILFNKQFAKRGLTVGLEGN